jgi:hypothetical protein
MVTTSLAVGTTTHHHGLIWCMHADDIHLQNSLRRRKAALEPSPLEIKLLAQKYGLSAGQIRGLLLKCEGDRKRLAEEAVRLRRL